ncbi:DUF4239 domain-containing protein [Rhizobium sp. S152]|uniref:bestrophin-like domain n=1 Tax=Rhizobium sp. S152 TaxID=3055038 RepID=UPI0025A9EFBA|nr:DUF4239 domain-containing protein [Rhizobium sp. S152]MDM9624855.1 DUF4239 domain-containing protein [Rhizobium sp. S152]
MTALETGGIVAVLLAGATLAGAWTSRHLPHHHLSTESKDAIKLATAVVGTLSALALGFLVASAKSRFDDAETELRGSGARLVLLDRIMAQYGSETADARKQLAKLVANRIADGWDVSGGGEPRSVLADDLGIEPVQRQLRLLSPQNDVQSLIKARALEVSGAIAEAHWLVLESGNEGLPTAFLVVLTFWLTVIFYTFGLLSPHNATVISIITVCALSVGGAIFIVNDMAHPYGGLIYVSDEPLRIALSRMGHQ